VSPRHPRLVALSLALACASDDGRRPDSATVAAVVPATSSTGTTPDDSLAGRAAARWVVTPQGFGPVVAGVSLQALGKTLGEPLTASYGAGATCAYVRPRALPSGVLVMVERDTVVRVDIRARGVLTAEGVGVGDAETRVAAVYEGRVRTAPNKYTGPAGHDLTVSARPDTVHLMVFETDGRAVVTYRAGSRAAVELVEACS
jgi:hypothetical protein